MHYGSIKGANKVYQEPANPYVEIDQTCNSQTRQKLVIPEKKMNMNIEK